MKKWFVYGKKADFQELGEKLSLDPVLVRILRNRDLTTEEEMRNFLEGEEIPSPLFLPDSIRFLNRLERAMKEGEKVRIVGDYDVDGVCASTILAKALSLFFSKEQLSVVIPHRILDGYGSKLMVGRFPLAVINIQIDPYLADVNVHPTKQEVRISKEKELMALISSAIAQSLREQDLIPDALENLAKSSTRGAAKPVQTSLPLKQTNLYYDSSRNDFFVKPETVQEDIKPLVSESKSPVSSVENKPQPSVKQAQRSVDEGDSEHEKLDYKNKSKMKRMLETLDNEETSTFPELEFFGQMHGTYLFAQGQGGLYIIDQHAAQERVKYEYYREKIGEVDSSLQQLLVPYLFEFSGSDYISLQEKMSLLNQVGIYLEPYGNNTFILREHPIWMKEEEIESAVYEMCDMLLLTNEVSVKTYRAELAIMMSCKRSIKANHALDDYSARDLLVQLAQCKNPYNCPHGRPVLVNFTKSDMEKMFRRIQENHTSLRDLGKY